MVSTLKRQLNDEEKKEILNRFGRRCFANGHAIAEGTKFSTTTSTLMLLGEIVI